MTGHLQQFGQISREDFERLVTTGLADADTAHLTFTEYFYWTVKNEIGGNTLIWNIKNSNFSQCPSNFLYIN